MYNGGIIASLGLRYVDSQDSGPLALSITSSTDIVPRAAVRGGGPHPGLRQGGARQYAKTISQQVSA